MGFYNKEYLGTNFTTFYDGYNNQLNTFSSSQ